MNADEALEELEFVHPLDLCRPSIAGVISQQAARIAELEQQRGGVVLPERADVCYGTALDTQLAEAYNEAIDEVARLNPPGECVAVPRELATRLCHRDNYTRQTARRELRNQLLAQQGKAVGE